MKKTLFSCALVVMALASCKKDDNGGGSTGGGSASVLTTGRWKLSASTSSYTVAGNTQTINTLSYLQACQLDNEYIFNTNGTTTADEGATKCSSSDPQTKTAGNWALSNGDTKLTIFDPVSSTTIVADVLSMDNTSFKIKYSYTANGITMLTTTTYARP